MKHGHIDLNQLFGGMMLGAFTTGIESLAADSTIVDNAKRRELELVS